MLQVLTYVAEVTRPHLRGILSTASSMSVSVGFLLQFLLGTFLTWRQVALINCVIPILGFILLCFIPETPIWLLSKNRSSDAKKSLAWLRGWTVEKNIEAEFEELCLKMKEDIKENESKTFLDNIYFLSKKEVYWPLILISYIFFLVHFGGSTSITTYAVTIFRSLKAPIDEYYVTVILGVSQLVGTMFCVGFIYVLGKRLITFISLFGTGLSILVVAVYIYLQDLLYLNEYQVEKTQTHWVPVVFIIVSAFLAFLSIIHLPWNLVGEVFPNQDRAKASGVVSAIGYIFSFIANKIFLQLVSLITLPGVFLFYSMVSLVGLIGLHFILPETEGKTLHEISDHFKGEGKLDNSIKRYKNNREVETKMENILL